MKFLQLSDTRKRDDILDEEFAGESQGFSPKGENIEKIFFSPRFIAYQGSSQRGNNILDCVIMRTTDSRARITPHRRVIRSILQYRALSVNFREQSLMASFHYRNSLLREARASSLPSFHNFVSRDQSS